MKTSRVAAVLGSCRSQPPDCQAPGGLKEGIQDSRVSPIAMPTPAGVSLEKDPFEPPPRKEIPLAWAMPPSVQPGGKMEVDVDSATEEACKFPQVPSGEVYGSQPYKMGQYNLWDSYESFIKDFVRSSKLQVHLNRRFMEHSAVFSEGMPFEGSTTYRNSYKSYDGVLQAITPAKSPAISSLPLQGLHRTVPSQHHITAKRPISSLPLQGSHRSVPSQPHHRKETHLHPASAGLAQVSTFTTTSQERDPSPPCLCRARTGQYLHNHITGKRPISTLPLQGSHRSVPSQPHHRKETHLHPASAGLAQVSTFTTTSQERDPSPPCLCRARTGQYLHNHITGKRPISTLPLQGSHRSVPSQPHHRKETHLHPASAGLAQVSTFTTTSQERDPSPPCLCRARTGQYLHNHITGKRPISTLPLQGSHRSVPSQPHHRKETHLHPASAGLAQVSTFTTTSQERDPSPPCLCRARTGQYLHNHITGKRPISTLPLQGSHRSVPSQPHHRKETHLHPASAGLAQVSTFTTTSQERDPSPPCLCRARTGQYLHNTTSQQRDPSPACLCRARTGQYLHNHIPAKRPISSLPLQGSHRTVPSQPHHSKETHLQPASAGLAQVSTFTTPHHSKETLLQPASAGLAQDSTFTTTSQQIDPSPACLCRARTGQYLHNTTSQQRDPSPACLCRARTGQYLHNHITAKRPISSLPLQGSHRSVPSQPHHKRETHLQPASAGLAQVSTFTTTSQQRDPSPACLCRARTGQYLHNHITAKRPISSLPLQGSHRSVPSQPHHSKETHLQPASAGLAQVSTFTTTSQQRDPSPACLCRARTGQYLHNHITAKRPISSLPLQGSHRSVPSQPHHSKETHLQPASAGLAQVSTFTTTSQQRDPSPACLCRARTGQYLHNHITAKRPISSLPLQGSHRRPWISEYNDIYGAFFRSFSGHHRHTAARSDPSKSSVLYIPHPPPARSSSQIKQQYQTEYRQAYTAPRCLNWTVNYSMTPKPYVERCLRTKNHPKNGYLVENPSVSAHRV
ncbi:UNVERIFIED_CONTAM: hypothetical protein FKN15_001920 [Acipenser sinensis]